MLTLLLSCNGMPCISGGGGGLSGGAIAGIIVGALAVLAILLAILGAHPIEAHAVSGHPLLT